MIPDTDLPYLRDDEMPLYLRITEGKYPLTAQNMFAADCKRLLAKLIIERKEIERLQIASGEVMPQSIGDEVV